MRAGVDDRQLESVLALYPLSEPSAIRELEESKRNDNFLVEEANGARYVLRRYRRNPNPQRMRFQLRFQRELDRLGYPTSQVIESGSGALSVETGAGAWALFSYVEGSEFDFARMDQVAEAGRRLAEFHTVTAAIDLDEVVIDINPDVRLWWTSGDEELDLAAMFAGDDVQGEMAFLGDWRDELARGLPLERLDALPRGWVHSDFHGRNMVFVGDELRGLFDFDPLHRGPSVEDVGHALFMFSREFRGSTHIRPDAASVFLSGYERVRRMTGEERAAVPQMAVLAWAPIAAYYKMLRDDGEDSLAFFRHYVALMRALREEAGRLGALLTG